MQHSLRPHRMGRLVMVRLAALVAVTLGAGSASAFERQWRVGGGLGAAHLDGAGFAPALGAHAAYGLSDMFDVHLELLGSRHRASGSTDVLSAAAGLSYKVDVFQWIPYIVVTGGAYHYGGDPGPNGEEGVEAGVALGVGLDYLASRELSLGVQLRQHTSFADGLSFPYLSGLLRAEYRWGW